MKILLAPQAKLIALPSGNASLERSIGLSRLRDLSDQ